MIAKRKHPKFNIPNYGAKGRKRVSDSWRAQRGRDNKKALKRSGYGASPNIGYKNSNAVRFARPDGSREMLIRNSSDITALIGSKGIVGRFSHALSRRKRAELQKIADANGIRIVNR
ncbi:MAG: eL32 family ribosomal protein [Candidatus Micrarchaeaceae archaeon]